MPLVDLHLHSMYSDDGEFAPETLLKLASEANVRAVALADHNSVASVTAAIDAGRERNILVVPAIEIDCVHDGINIHILGYFIDHTDPRWLQLQNDVAEESRAGSDLRIRRVEELGIVVNREALAAKAKNTGVIVEYIVEVALTDPANHGNPILAPYSPGGDRSDNPLVNFYWDYCSQGKPGYVPINYMSAEQAICLIRDTGGAAVLAHPEVVLKNEAKRLPELADKGIVGVEAYSNYHTPEKCGFWREQARASNLFITCGSDFHGRTKPAIRVGEHGASEPEQAAAIRNLCAAVGRDGPEWSAVQ